MQGNNKRWQPLLENGYEIQAGIEKTCLIHIVTNANRGDNGLAARNNIL